MSIIETTINYLQELKLQTVFTDVFQTWHNPQLHITDTEQFWRCTLVWGQILVYKSKL